MNTHPIRFLGLPPRRGMSQRCRELDEVEKLRYEIRQRMGAAGEARKAV